MRQTSSKEIEAVLRLDGPSRFRHFIKRVVDEEVAWGLWNDGWALMGDDAGVSVFPLWPAREYAELARTGEWVAYRVEPITLDDLLGDLLPSLIDKAVLPGVFPTPAGKGVTPTVKELESALRLEMREYGE
jgi:hypothetical protein